MIKHDSALYSQHIKGTHNVIADSLSRDHHVLDTHLTYMFKQLFPLQAQMNFEIQALPLDNAYWMRSLKPTLTKTGVWHQPPCKIKLGALSDGRDSWPTWVSKMNTLQNIHLGKENTSCVHLRQAVEEINLGQSRRQYSPEGQSSPPSQMYARPFGQIYTQTRL